MKSQTPKIETLLATHGEWHDWKSLETIIATLPGFCQRGQRTLYNWVHRNLVRVRKLDSGKSLFSLSDTLKTMGLE